MNIKTMILKWLFDRIAAFCALFIVWWILLIVAILIKINMPGPVLFVQKRVGKNGKLFYCHKFRSMKVNHGGSSVSVSGESRITPMGAVLRKYKLDELPELWDVFVGNMSFVGPRPDVPGYADMLEGDDREVLLLTPGITGPATLKYRNEEKDIADFVNEVSKGNKYVSKVTGKVLESQDLQQGKYIEDEVLTIPLGLSEQELAVWYNDNVIYPDKVRINRYYLHHYSFLKDIQMIFATVLGKRMQYGGEIV